MSRGLPLGQTGYLRVSTPQTTDGTNLKYDAKQRIVMKETHLPLTARKHLERENSVLPVHLQHIIEEVSNEAPPKGKPGRKKKEEVEGDNQEEE
jgi:hypothetical protein